MNKLVIFAMAVCLPLRHLSLTSGYGYRIHPVTGQYRFHAGVDLKARNDTVFAVMPGVISATGHDPLLGVYIRLHCIPFEVNYGHLSQIFVLPGDSVYCGEPIGKSGATGRVTGEHLHFSVSFNGHAINPLKFLLSVINNLNQIKKENQP